jgi:SRSO17 transposase
MCFLFACSSIPITVDVVLAEAACGNNCRFREDLKRLELRYALRVQSTITMWLGGNMPLFSPPYRGLRAKIGVNQR